MLINLPDTTQKHGSGVWHSLYSSTLVLYWCQAPKPIKQGGKKQMKLEEIKRIYRLSAENYTSTTLTFLKEERRGKKLWYLKTCNEELGPETLTELAKICVALNSEKSK
jgi:hypothetical protein